MSTGRDRRMLMTGGGIALLFVLLRFLHIDADFPSGITSSGVLYTDEGWYANSAIRHFLTGEWYLKGDFNPAINMPVGQLLHRISFAIFGPSLFSVRLLVLIASVSAILLTAALVRRDFGPNAGLLTALFLSTSYLGFAYSRLAIMEPVGVSFVLIGIALAHSARDRLLIPCLALASLMGGLAILVKSSMVFVVPLLAYLAWTKGSSKRQSLIYSFSAASLALLVSLGYQGMARHYFREDFLYFSNLNLNQRMVDSAGAWAFNVVERLKSLIRHGGGIVAFSLLMSAAAALASRKFRRSQIVHLLSGYIVLYFGMLTLVNYGPPRYFLPLLPPFAGLGAISCIELCAHLRGHGAGRRWAAIPCFLAAGVILTGSLKILTYLSNPAYSFKSMMADVRTIIVKREGQASRIVLLGNFSDSVSLETGVTAINSDLGTSTLAERIQRHRPSYALVHTDEHKILNTLSSMGASTVMLGSWDVFGNYYGNRENVKLFGVSWGPCCTRP